MDEKIRSLVQDRKTSLVKWSGYHNLVNVLGKCVIGLKVGVGKLSEFGSR